MIDYHCVKFGEFSFRFIVRTDRQTDRHADRITDGDDRYTHATIPSASVRKDDEIQGRHFRQFIRDTV